MTRPVRTEEDDGAKIMSNHSCRECDGRDALKIAPAKMASTMIAMDKICVSFIPLFPSLSLIIREPQWLVTGRYNY